MTYTLEDYIASLRDSAMGKEKDIDMQSDEALEIVNDCLPRNKLARTLFKTGSPKLLISDKKLREDNMASEYIEQVANNEVLPVMKEYPGDKLTSTEVKRLGKLMNSDNAIIQALDYLETAGEVVSFAPTPEKPKRWTSIKTHA